MPNQSFKIFTTLLFFVLLINQSYGQNWKTVDETILDSKREKRQIIPDVYTAYSVDIHELKDILETGNEEDGKIEVVLPVGGKQLQYFKVHRSDVFHPYLAAKYPDIRAYTGYNIDNPNQIVKLSISHLGMDAMFLGGGQPQSYIDAYSKGDDSHYISYLKSDFPKSQRHEFSCTVEEPNDGYKKSENNLRYGDCTLRTYRLAMACTGEYATFHGGTVESVLAAYNTAMNRVNGIYERDAAITMQLVADTDQLIFFDAATDPYDNDSGGTMLGQNQNVVDQTIGTENYDIGHVFSTGGGGIASLRSPCNNNRKARGVTGLASPINDPFYVDYVAHEMGHQFGGNHCYNNSCNDNRSDNTAVEPGSGATIMAYAGICAPNVQNRSDDYFHTISLEEIANFVVAGNGGCAEETALNNVAPSIESVGQDVIIPGGTPFALTAVATDGDDNELTYTWEQMDNEIADMPPEATSIDGPVFRSYDPTTNPVRYFPRLTNILNGTNGNTWEVLPTVSRVMNFRATVRDNAIGGGCTDYDDVTVTVHGEAGPFVVTAPTNTTLWNSGGVAEVQWDVAGTNQAPINCELVDIYLATDENRNFDMLLAEGVPNIGVHEINVPSINTNTARVMVRCANNIFLDVNDGDFAIIAPFSTVLNERKIIMCPGDNQAVIVNYIPNNDFDEETTFSTSNVPNGMNATLNMTTVTDTSNIELQITAEQSLAAGTYEIELNGLSSTASSKDVITVNIASPTNQVLVNKLPSNGSRGVDIVTQLSWDNVVGHQGYQVQVSTDAGFAELLRNEISTTNTYLLNGLEVGTVYYWRVAIISPCFDLSYQEFQAFQTGGLDCETLTSEEEIVITQQDDNNITSDIEIEDNTTIGIVNIGVNVAHSYVGDLTGNITSPTGQVVNLFDRAGEPASFFGCGGDDIDVKFSDASEKTYDEFEMTCNQNGGPAISGDFQPLESLAIFSGESAQGIWTLGLTDLFDPDGGMLNSWYIEVCQTSEISEGIVVINTGLELVDVANALIEMSNLNVESGDDLLTTYMVKETPMFGSVQIFDADQGGFLSLDKGQTFTQKDIFDGIVRYQFEGNEDTSDEIVFDIVDEQNRWVYDERFVINVEIGMLTASTNITNPIKCAGESNAEIEIMGVGGVMPYTYSLNAIDYQEDKTFSGLLAGVYTGYVKDNSGIVSETEFVIPDPAAIMASVDVQREVVTVTASGGTGNLQYSTDNSVFQNGNVFSLSNQTDYTITIKDENDCNIQIQTRVDYVEDYSLMGTDVICNNDATGAIEFQSIIGGLEPYMYTIDPGNTQEEPVFENLTSGVYNTSVQDANGVSYSKQITIGQPSPYNISVDTLGSTAQVNVIGNTSPYTYSLNGGEEQEESLFEELLNGEYTVVVTDANGCEGMFDFVIENSTVSTQFLEGALLNIYPNPVTEKLTIDHSKDYKFDRLQIFDVRGAKVYDGTFCNTMDVSKYANGIYIIKLLNKSEVGTVRFLKSSKQ